MDKETGMDIRTREIRLDRDRSTHGSFIDAEFVMHIVFSGSFMFQCENEVYSVRGHDVILMRPNTLHALLDITGIDMLVIHFFERSQYLDGLDFPFLLHLSMDKMQPISELAMKLLSYWDSPSPELKIACDGIVQAIVGLYLHHGHGSAPQNVARDSIKNWESVKAAVQFIQESYADEDLNVTVVADRVGLSYNYFCSLFHRFTNETPLDYISRIRLENAKRKLFNDRLNISETAIACGFRSIQNFSKTFKRYEGRSPSQWMKAQQS